MPLITTNHLDFRLNPEATYSQSSLFCGCISLRFGCALACAVWLTLDVYIAALAFQGYTPVFSFLTAPALYTLAGISTFFGIISVFLLFGLLQKSITVLQIGFNFLVICVILFIVDVLASIIIFGVKYTDYDSWCTGISAGQVDEKVSVSFVNGTKIQFEYTPSPSNNDLYNCNKLWQDEIKLGIAVWLVIAIAYIYWMICIYDYYHILEELMQIRAPLMPYLPATMPTFNNFWIPPFMQVMRNNPPSSAVPFPHKQSNFSIA